MLGSTTMNQRRGLAWRAGLVLTLAGTVFGAGSALAQAPTTPTTPTTPAGAAGAAGARTDASISRRGEGARRVALNAMERQAFPADAWAQLSDWQNGAALSRTATDGRVVLVAMWTDYLPTNRRVPATVERLVRKHGASGLIGVMVHGQEDWANATKPKAPAGATLLVAHDAQGKFREALNASADPSYYIIDRAGQLRFADVAGDSVEAAVDLLVAESAGDAAGLNDRLKREAEARDREARRAAAINQQADLTNFPVLPFPEPSAEDYEKANWPRLPLDESRQRTQPGATFAPVNVSLPESGWYPRVPDKKGKIVVAYLWNPADFFTYHDIMPRADLLQRQYRRDVVVVGLASAFDNKVGGRQYTDDERDAEKATKRVEQIFASRKFEHSLALMFDKENLYTTITTSTTIPVPTLLIISTDGKARWWPHEDQQTTFEAALLRAIEVDPAVQARRRAEDEWLRRQGGAPAPAAAPTEQSTPAAPPAASRPAPLP